jgi:tetratricopeptide (TPR) repeat protein
MAPASYEKVVLLLRVGRLAEAEAAARELIAADPDSPLGYSALGHVFEGGGRFPEALQASDAALSKNPNLAVLHIQRSRVMEYLARVPEAISAAEEAVRLDPDDPRARVRLASALFQADRVGEMKAVVADARERFPHDLDVVYQVGLVALCEEDARATAAAARQGQALDPADPRFHLLAGVAAAQQAREECSEGAERQRRYQQAERLLAEAVRLEPTNHVYRQIRKRNASDSRDDVMASLLAWWLVAAGAAGFFLPYLLMRVFVPWWGWIPETLGVWFLGIFFHARCPEFNLAAPMWWRRDVVDIPLMPEEERKGDVRWYVFLALTAAVLFLPMLLVGR